jgi:hypothetical protein
MRAGHRLSLISAFAVLSTYAGAQTLPWPTDPPRAGGAAPGGAVAPAAPAAPMAMPMTRPAPMAMPMPGGAAPMGGGFGAPPAFGGAEPPCMPEFLKLRADVEQKGRATKALSDRKPSREEACKQLTLYSAAEGKWAKFTEANVASCGIPREVAQQLKTMHERTDQMRKAVCATGPAAAGPGPAAPSLSDALGTARLPMPESTKSGGGSTFDTLSGNILQK